MDLQTRPYSIDMEKKDLRKLTKGQLIKLLLKKVSNHEDLLDNDPFKDEVAQRIKPTQPPRTGKCESVKPKPVPRKSVNEDRYKPIPKPRTDRPLQIPKIKELNRALKGHAKSYEIELQDNLNPLNHFTKTRPLTESHLEDLLKTMKGFKFIETLEVTFEKDTIDSKTGKRVSIYKTAFFSGKAKIVTKVDDLEPELKMSRQDCGYGYKVICCYDDKYSKHTHIYRGENVVYKFMEKMLEEVEYCKAVIKKHFNKPLVMTEVDEQHFKTMDGCHICGEKYTDKDVLVRDHCHITGKFRGSAHKECNLKLRIKPENLKIPIIFHNLRGYDSHFIMQQIGEIAKKHAYTNKKGEKQDLNINAIPNNMEKYMALMLGNHLTFIDSFKFMSSSVDKPVSNLPKDDLIYTSKAFKGKRLNLMSQKGVYPYDFMDSFEKFNQMELPNRDQFYSILNDQHITDDEYDQANKVWKYL